MKGNGPEEEKEETEAEKRKDLRGLRLLLVEDNELNREIASELLSMYGASIDTAENGQIAVDKIAGAEAGRYDLILMDIQMPVMDGYQAAREIRKLPDPEKAGIPIVALTANAFEKDRKLALEAGMQDHVTKPINAEVVMASIINCVS